MCDCPDCPTQPEPARCRICHGTGHSEHECISDEYNKSLLMVDIKRVMYDLSLEQLVELKNFVDGLKRAKNTV